MTVNPVGIPFESRPGNCGPETFTSTPLTNSVDLEIEDGVFETGEFVSVVGKAKGKGFQGVVKRWGFAGGPGSHGSTFHRRPGSLGNMRRQGEVLKGKRLPGRAGFRNFTVRGLTMARIDGAVGCVFL